jgi:transposase
MMVLGIDTHTKSYTVVAVEAASGEIKGELTVQADQRGSARLLAWARALEAERLFALEDCRQVSSRLERFLLAAGEHCLRVPPQLTAQGRRAARQRGKSDALDAAAVARAALREPDLPAAHLPGPELELRLLSDHRSALVAERTRTQQRLRWHLLDLELPLEVPPRRLGSGRWLARLEEALADLPGVRARIARELVARCRALNGEIASLTREIGELVGRLAPELLALPGCGPLTSASLVGQSAGARRFASAACFAMHAGVAPLPASSGRTQRHRLNRRGNRQLNAALHRLAVSQLRLHEPARVYVARKRAEGKSTREALRCLKRHLAKTVWRELCRAEARREAEAAPEVSQPSPVLTS